MPRTPDTDGEIFEQLRPRLKAISCRIVGSEAEAEDIVQDCFFKWRDAEQSALGTPAAWLTTVVQHQSIDRLRKRARETIAARVATELTPDVPPESPEDAALRRGALGEALTQLLTRLSPSERLALVLHEVFECGHADIAAALGTKTVNARQYLARARRRLREQQAHDDIPPSEKLNRELIRRFQAAINGMDMPAILTLLADEQPMSVLESPRLRIHAVACANDAAYCVALAA
jgi:RNA polymerase sigma-70 factor (ECF subfamily)